MNTIIFSPHNRLGNRLGILLNELQECIDEQQGDVFLITCSKSFDVCDQNINGELSRCYLCQANQRNNLRQIKGDFKHLSLKEVLKEDMRGEALKHFETESPINKDSAIDQFDIGEAIISPYLTVTRDMEMVGLQQHPYTEKAFINSLLVYWGLTDFIKTNNIDQVITFNGRWDYYRAALSAGIKSEIKVKVIESTRPGGYVKFVYNKLIHDKDFFREEVLKTWNRPTHDVEEKKRIGSQFFIDKSFGTSKVYSNHTKDDNQGRLPADFDYDSKNYVLFNNSDFEFSAVGKDYRSKLFDTQKEGTEYLVDLFGNKFPDMNLYVRMHPNLKGMEMSSFDNTLRKARTYSNVHIIAPEEAVDSYELLKHAEKVLVFRSSMGLEACYWDKEVILLGRTFYMTLDVANYVDDLADLEEAITKPVNPKPALEAIKAGYYFQEGGEKMKYYYNKERQGGHYFKQKPIYSYNLIQRIRHKGLKLIDRLRVN